MEGHFHVEVQDGTTFNEKTLRDALDQAKATDLQVVAVGFVCTYGCGVLHRLKAIEMDEVRQHGVSVSDDVTNGDPAASEQH